MGDYFRHWLNMRKTDQASRRAFSTSTGSARTATGKFLWPGFGENMRVLKWIVDRCHGRDRRRRDAARLGARPRQLRPGRHEQLLAREAGAGPGDQRREWRREVLMQDELFMKLYAHLPKELIFQRELLLARL